MKCTKSEHNKIHNKVYPGESNGNYSNITNDELKKLFVEKTKFVPIDENGRFVEPGGYGTGGTGCGDITPQQNLFKI